MALLADLVRSIERKQYDRMKVAAQQEVAQKQESANYQILLEEAEKTLLKMLDKGEIPNDIHTFILYRDKLMKGQPLDEVLGIEGDMVGLVSPHPADTTTKQAKDDYITDFVSRLSKGLSK